MAYIEPSEVTTGDLVTAAKWNQDVVANAIAAPHVYNRQGGDADNWQTAGGTAYVPVKVRIEVGARSLTINDGQAIGTVEITLPGNYPSGTYPMTFVTLRDNSFLSGVVSISAIATDSTINVYAIRTSTSGNYTLEFNWMTIGPAA